MKMRFFVLMALIVLSAMNADAQGLLDRVR